MEERNENWVKNKERIRSMPPELSKSQKKKFLELVSRDASSVDFETKCGMGRLEVAHYKNLYLLESTEDARRKLNDFLTEESEYAIRFEEEQRLQAGSARIAAEARLLEMQNSKVNPEYDLIKLAAECREEDVVRQKRFQELNGKTEMTDWRLSFDRDENEAVRVFVSDILNRGLSFCVNKYNCTRTDIRSEITRRKISINWDLVRN